MLWVPLKRSLSQSADWPNQDICGICASLNCICTCTTMPIVALGIQSGNCSWYSHENRGPALMETVFHQVCISQPSPHYLSQTTANPVIGMAVSHLELAYSQRQCLSKSKQIQTLHTTTTTTGTGSRTRRTTATRCDLAGSSPNTCLSRRGWTKLGNVSVMKWCLKAVAPIWSGALVVHAWT